MGDVPLDLLFIDAPRVSHPETSTPGVDDNGWMPLAPGQGRLDSASEMTYTEEGYLLRAVHDPAISVFMVASESHIESHFRLSAFTEPPPSNNDDHDQQYWIESLSLMDQYGNRRDPSETCIIIQKTGGNLLKGARFEVMRRHGDKIFLRYDCALRILSKKDPPATWPPSTPCFRARVPPVDSVLYLEHG